MTAPVELIKLVEQFHEHPEMYIAETFSETSLRRQFIDPMLELLSWEVYNRQGYAEAYKDRQNNKCRIWLDGTQRGRESFSGNDQPHGKRLARKRLPTPSAKRDTYSSAGPKDVMHEDSLKIGGSTKAPDYSFRIGGVRKFFVEAAAQVTQRRT